MGALFFDTYSLLHFAAGIISYYWGFNFKWWFIVNIIYEMLDNTFYMIIDKIPKWPGGKKIKDSIVNSTSDIIFSLLGWVFARWFDISISKTNKPFFESIQKSVIKNFKNFFVIKKNKNDTTKLFKNKL